MMVQGNISGKVRTVVYNEPTSSNRNLNYESDHPTFVERSVIKTIHTKSKTICSIPSDKEIRDK